jgi:hypothetical protein
LSLTTAREEEAEALALADARGDDDADVEADGVSAAALLLVTSATEGAVEGATADTSEETLEPPCASRWHPSANPKAAVIAASHASRDRIEHM